MISCLIVNYNCIDYTKALVEDVKAQYLKDFEVLIVDQNSIEKGTKEFLSKCDELLNFTVVENSTNRPLNRIWNEFVEGASGEYCSFLNNDIVIPPNFLQDTVQIFENEPDVSCVIHPTNHPNWSVYKNLLEYEVLEKRTRQGWDFSFRKSDWVPIPDVLDFYCGDDFIFENVYLRNKKVAMATSSPVIHWLSRTRKSPLNTVIPNRNPPKDIENYKKLGFKHYLDLLPEYSNAEPTIKCITASDK